jgi:threonyl-tRNA synthetase
MNRLHYYQVRFPMSCCDSSYKKENPQLEAQKLSTEKHKSNGDKELQIKTHQQIGQELKLFMIHEWSPGSIFFLPHGQRIYNRLQEIMRREYRHRGFEEVSTPLIFNTELWKKSGHWEHYEANMFKLDVGEAESSLKPMNCPSHCLIYKSELRSARDLPLRLVDFGVLHRNEISGALTGLTRVRKFSQDDGHIFCRENQIKEEIVGSLQFLKDIYDQFGFTFQFYLSTRPEKAMGELDLWDRAEKGLTEALQELDLNYTIDPQGGAFYGPKIDIKLKDSLGRDHQCGTIQLDFQQPLNFDLRYKETNGDIKDQPHPVIVHRAIYGSFERFIAILLEHYQGQLPFWISPRQIKIIPISEAQLPYASKVNHLLRSSYWSDVDSESETLKKKIKCAELLNYNYILVVGQKEVDMGTVCVRKDSKVVGNVPLSDLLDYFCTLQFSISAK